MVPIFIDCDEAERRYRRMQREEVIGTFPGSFMEFWKWRCEPTFHKEVLPQRSSANVILNSPWSTIDFQNLVQKILRLMK
jgi:uridine kinase